MGSYWVQNAHNLIIDVDLQIMNHVEFCPCQFIRYLQRVMKVKTTAFPLYHPFHLSLHHFLH